jgi:hypothetical protein
VTLCSDFHLSIVVRMSTDIAIPEGAQEPGQSSGSEVPEVAGFATHEFHYFVVVTFLVSSLVYGVSYAN